MDHNTSFARAATRSASATSAFQTPEIIFNIVPSDEGPALLALVYLYCIALGAVTVELFNHLDYDIRLIRKPGWTQPAKLISRIAYLLCRVLPPTAISMFLFDLSLKRINCAGITQAIGILSMLLFASVALIMAQRTMAVYAWKRSLVIPLTVFYLILVASMATSVPFWTVGRRLPFFGFCVVDDRRYETRTIVTNVVYKSLGLVFDVTLLLIMLHRLLEGGLPSLWLKRNAQRNPPDWQGQGISSLLIRQGIQVFVLQLACDVFLAATWLGFKSLILQGIGTPFSFSIPPIAATAAFREIGETRRNMNHNTERVNELMDSMVEPLDDRSRNPSTGKASVQTPRPSPSAKLHASGAASATESAQGSTLVQATSRHYIA
ncbi:hypothetical protein PSEUBRA_001623 [Kalmanozyma brasiliensis GHG001]|uniref:uncharacterized protein n=1 Tax=Kalmanozyma brasiliensis (strain GHG001) TaxID=1365824 RepID=UPI0028681DAC|nr:uncharacterized protein PSEUBRA_001623 [Kalmanozyma brasiliensis GHG001]KAF6766980.1 hypothetical protein PSEUBRA_001623 [Kalmanozyma brasiliensis GHG001]